MDQQVTGGIFYLAAQGYEPAEIVDALAAFEEVEGYFRRAIRFGRANSAQEIVAERVSEFAETEEAAVALRDPQCLAIKTLWRRDFEQGLAELLVHDDPRIRRIAEVIRGYPRRRHQTLRAAVLSFASHPYFPDMVAFLSELEAVARELKAGQAANFA